jgi:uracil-DNA glycosylase family 4
MTRIAELEKIHDAIIHCTRCPLHKSRKHAVPGAGPVDAQLMFVGEAPGAQEDEEGLPFVGRSGQLLTDLLSEVGIRRESVFITSVLKSRPPNNRTPTSTEITLCRPYLERQIEVISPQCIVLLGSVAISSLIGPWKMAEAHGKFHVSADRRQYFMTYHPAAALRFPKYRDEMLADFRKLKAGLE